MTRKFMLLLAMVAAAMVAVPATAPAKAPKKKPKPAVYAIYGGYDLTSVIYSSCMPGSGGVVNETTRVKRHYAYSGDTKRGITIKETQQEFLIRESTNEFLPSNSIMGDPSERTTKTKGSDVVTVKGSRGTFSYHGIGADNDSLSFKAPKKPGDARQIKLDTNLHEPSDPGVGCQVLYEDTTVAGAVLVKRIQ